MSGLATTLSDCFGHLLKLRQLERTLVIRRYGPLETPARFDATHSRSQGERSRIVTDLEVALVEALFAQELAGRSPVGLADLVSLMEPAGRTTLSEAVKRGAFLINKISDATDRPGRGPWFDLTTHGKQLAYRLQRIDRYLIPKLLNGTKQNTDLEAAIIEMFDNANARLKRAMMPTGSAIAALEHASVARFYDYLTGGHFYFAVDAEAAEALVHAFPFVAAAAKANRAFVRRATQYMVNDGITQFIDLGCGLPSFGGLHDVVTRNLTNYRVLYVDSDPEVVRAITLMTEKRSSVYAFEAACSEITNIIDEAIKNGFDPNERTGVMCAAVLHFEKDSQAAREMLERVASLLPGGGLLALSHGSIPEGFRQEGAKVVRHYEHLVGNTYPRTRAELQTLLDGFELAPARVGDTLGELVFAPEWRPDISDYFLFGDTPPLEGNPPHSMNLAAVARIPRHA